MVAYISLSIPLVPCIVVLELIILAMATGLLILTVTDHKNLSRQQAEHSVVRSGQHQPIQQCAG